MFGRQVRRRIDHALGLGDESGIDDRADQVLRYRNDRTVRQRDGAAVDVEGRPFDQEEGFRRFGTVRVARGQAERRDRAPMRGQEGLLGIGILGIDRHVLGRPALDVRHLTGAVVDDRVDRIAIRVRRCDVPVPLVRAVAAVGRCAVPYASEKNSLGRLASQSCFGCVGVRLQAQLTQLRVELPRALGERRAKNGVGREAHRFGNRVIPPVDRVVVVDAVGHVIARRPCVVDGGVHHGVGAGRDRGAGLLRRDRRLHGLVPVDRHGGRIVPHAHGLRVQVHRQFGHRSPQSRFCESMRLPGGRHRDIRDYPVEGRPSISKDNGVPKRDTVP